MIKKIFSISLFILFTIAESSSQDKTTLLTTEEIKAMNTALEADSFLAARIGWFGKPVELYEQYKVNLVKADSIWMHDQKTLAKMEDIGCTEHFEMIPLVEWFTNDESLTGEPGVSYLIKTDEATILFDVGLNAKNEHPSPLLRNMDKLGIKLEEIDIIVISHNHGDHVGGGQWARKNTFSLTNHQADIGQKKVFTPVEMTYPGLNPIHTPKPLKIASGVATIGVINCPVFFTDIGEQALAVNVKDKGMVIISGCGHQTIEKILQRTEILFDEPIYAIFGGFHYPLEEMRNITSIYKYVITGKLPWERLTREDVENNVNLMKSKGVKMAGLSGHDSCDKSISVFKEVFRDCYTDIAIGKKIVIN